MACVSFHLDEEHLAGKGDPYRRLSLEKPPCKGYDAQQEEVPSPGSTSELVMRWETYASCGDGGLCRELSPEASAHACIAKLAATVVEKEQEVAYWKGQQFASVGDSLQATSLLLATAATLPPSEYSAALCGSSSGHSAALGHSSQSIREQRPAAAFLLRKSSKGSTRLSGDDHGHVAHSAPLRTTSSVHSKSAFLQSSWGVAPPLANSTPLTPLGCDSGALPPQQLAGLECDVDEGRQETLGPQEIEVQHVAPDCSSDLIGQQQSDAARLEAPAVRSHSRPQTGSPSASLKLQHRARSLGSLPAARETPAPVTPAVERLRAASVAAVNKRKAAKAAAAANLANARAEAAARSEAAAKVRAYDAHATAVHVEPIVPKKAAAAVTTKAVSKKAAAAAARKAAAAERANARADAAAYATAAAKVRAYGAHTTKDARTTKRDPESKAAKKAAAAAKKAAAAAAKKAAKKAAAADRANARAEAAAYASAASKVKAYGGPSAVVGSTRDKPQEYRRVAPASAATEPVSVVAPATDDKRAASERIDSNNGSVAQRHSMTQQAKARDDEARMDLCFATCPAYVLHANASYDGKDGQLAKAADRLHITLDPESLSRIIEEDDPARRGCGGSCVSHDGDASSAELRTEAAIPRSKPGAAVTAVSIDSDSDSEPERRRAQKSLRRLRGLFSFACLGASAVVQ